MIVAGERRWRAAWAAGLREVPCIEMEVDESSIAEIALIENMQRKDLTPWEEADGLFALCYKFGYTHDDAAKKVGKSRTSVTEALSIASLPEEVREECRRAHIDVKSTLIQIARQPDVAAMLTLVREITDKGLKRDEARAARKIGNGEGSGDPYKRRKKDGVKFKYSLPGLRVRLELHFDQERVEGEDIIPTLREIISALEKESEVLISRNMG
jgi:ParB family transcriptional regulator, chromosome partitioning protein